jgi:hypothetical protein
MFPGPLEKKLYALYNFLVFYNLKSSLKSTTNREYHFFSQRNPLYVASLNQSTKCTAMPVLQPYFKMTVSFHINVESCRLVLLIWYSDTS